MPSKKKATDEEILEAYRQLGSVHKVGVMLGMHGGSVHERLVRLGANVPVNVITDTDRETIKAYYEQTHPHDFDLKALAKSLKRTVPLISRTAKEMGLTQRDRPQSKATHKKIVSRSKKTAQSRYPQPDRAEFPNIRFRSTWEANYARYLNWRVDQGEIRSWEYEVETFWFMKIMRGVRSYTPDFKIYPIDGEPYFIELKGYMDARSLTKLKRMRIYHPEVRVDLVAAKDYKVLTKVMKPIIPNWET